MSHQERTPFQNPVIEWIDLRLPVFTMLVKEYGTFPTPRNFNYLWSFGGLALFMLVSMIVTGVVLAMQYTASTTLAFDSVERIMRDVNWGWLVRYIHMNGASMFFIVVYIHMFRGLYYGSYKQPRELLWILGVLIFLLMMATAFMGYVLPWGQMSFWGATVITNIFSAVPLVGDKIVTWLWGGFSVDNPTLTRFFALHYLLPFVIFGVAFLHVAALHISGSGNPLGIEPKGPQDTIPFHPYYTAKDLFALTVFLVFFAAMVFFAPNYLGHPDNYIPANPAQTPPHIVPEWYFLPFYAMLRAVTIDITIPFTSIIIISSKLGGAICMFGSIAILFLLPWIDRSPVRSAVFRPIYRKLFWVFVIDCFLLGYVGSQPADGTLGPIELKYLGVLGLVYYFGFFVILFFLPKFEKTEPLPDSIAASVLHSPTASETSR
ncbi:MAG: cytochrome b/b6 [Alphaproteobacteria bacterium]